MEFLAYAAIIFWLVIVPAIAYIRAILAARAKLEHYNAVLREFERDHQKDIQEMKKKVGSQ